MSFAQDGKPGEGETLITIKTNHGEMEFKLFAQHTPKTVENFLGLSKEGKYNDTVFHRIIKDFMVQWGDYENANGTWGKSIWGSEFEDEFHEDLSHIKWALSMANAGPGTNGSQFFIVHSDATPWLDWAHSVFGQMTDGWDVLEAMADVDVNHMDAPHEPVVIHEIILLD